MVASKEIMPLFLVGSPTRFHDSLFHSKNHSTVKCNLNKTTNTTVYITHQPNFKKVNKNDKFCTMIDATTTGPVRAKRVPERMPG